MTRMRIPRLATLARKSLRRFRGSAFARPVVHALDRVWWARVIRRADLIDDDLIRAQGFRTPRAALRAYVRGGFRTGVTLNPLAMERLIASQLSDVGRVPALYAYLVNDPRRIRVSVNWDAVGWAEAHPEALSDPAGPLGHRWRLARAEGRIALGTKKETTSVPWSTVVSAMGRSARREPSGPMASSSVARIVVCEVGKDEPDLAYALDAVLDTAAQAATDLVIALDSDEVESWLACTLVWAWHPRVRVQTRDARLIDSLPVAPNGVVVVRGAGNEISSADLHALATAGTEGPVAPLWLDETGAIASAGLVVSGGRYRHLLSGHPAEDAQAAGEWIAVPRIAAPTFAHPLGSSPNGPGRTLLGAVVRAPRLSPPIESAPGPDTDVDPYLRPAGLVAVAGAGGRPRVERRLPDATSAGATPRLRWALKIAAPPGRPGEFWGDTHFARGLADALRRLGQDVVIDAYEARKRPSARLDDVVLALRGPEPIDAQDDAVSLLWVISHPDELTAGEAASFDAVFAASRSWARETSVSWGREVRTLLQCTDTRRFHPRGLPRTSERVFVGTARGIARPSVVEPVKAGLQLSVYGPDWTGYIPAHTVVARSVPNAALPALYESADIVMNDHWPAMQRAGFISNRLFDVVAAGGRAISDEVDGVGEIFGGAVATYRTIDELLTLLRRPSEEVFPLPEELARIGAEVRAAHSFDARARTLLDRALELR